ncbi:MAG: hypothetical protein ACI89R_000479 [Candidatus Azotimanducaceae bacterium]|jgi:hypothetical protein
MKFTPSKVNIFLLAKLPSAYLSGVRMKSITEDKTVVTVRHRWINQNPFKSIYWAVQGMASELTTGMLVMKQIADSGKKISMLVTHQSGTFTKKARGKITFTCNDGPKIKQAIDKTIATGEGETITLISEGVDESGDNVSRFEYEWSVKAKK